MILETPIEVTWSFTKKCNLSCSFCLVDAGRGRDAILSQKERFFILDEIIGGKVLKVILTGGEPLCEPEVFTIIEKLRKNNIAVELTTNGTLIDDKIIDKLIGCGLRDIQISINGPNALINDKMMGKSFNKIIDALNICLKKDISLHTKTTITAQNIAHIPAMTEMLKSMGIKKIDLDEVIPMGRAIANYNLLKPPTEMLSKLEAFVDEINSLEKPGEVEFSSFTLSMLEDGRAAECSLGDENSFCSTITFDGNLYPCTLSALWKEGNSVPEKGLRQCWKDISKFGNYLDSKKLGGRCASCKEKADCKGGCRALAYALTENIWSEYPLCPAI